eukprot:scaffold2771_cov252-Pinguiococcus_pyrenoidosus.AAC.24
MALVAHRCHVCLEAAQEYREDEGVDANDADGEGDRRRDQRENRRDHHEDGDQHIRDAEIGVIPPAPLHVLL